MNLIFFVHPSFLEQQSMIRYARMLSEGMKKRGHQVQVWSPKPRFFQFGVTQSIKKWLGYIDQYIEFPIVARRLISKCPDDTLFIFTDHALGPWVPLVARRPHIIHCHDFLAQRSALGEIPRNRTGFTGRIYQALIRKGYKQGRNFISISNKTRQDLHRFLPARPLLSKVVYNGLNQAFTPSDATTAGVVLGDKFGLDLTYGYLLHIGGNQWYKNRPGVIKIYDTWRSKGKTALPLLMMGQYPDKVLSKAWSNSSFKSDIHILSDIEDKYIALAYNGANVFLFPSIEEGFGWPIAEAMASGCPVITTDQAPMTEVAGNAAFLIPPAPYDEVSFEDWVKEAATVLDKVVNLIPLNRNKVTNEGLKNIQRFSPESMLNEIENIYKDVILAENNPLTSQVKSYT